MSWNCMLAVVCDTSFKELTGLGVRVTSVRISADEAATGQSPDLCAMEVGGHVLFIGQEPELFDQAEEMADRLDVEAVCAGFNGLSDCYVWQVVGPEIDRDLVWVAGEAVVDTGPPLLEEETLDEDGLTEDSLFEMLEARTGVSPNWADATAYLVTVHGLEHPAPLHPAEDQDSRKPSLLGRIFGRR